MKTNSLKPDPNTPAIEFRNVSLSFDHTQALKDVSFKLQHGQMIVITGLSRSGKSVLLHLAIGLLEPDEGEVLIEGHAIKDLSEKELLELRSTRMGIVFQEDTLFTGMTVYENAAYRLTEHAWSEEDTDRTVQEILRFVGLEKDADKLPEELSIGMRRRLEIARALAGWPPIMLFDEPTSGLDPITTKQILDLVIRARDIHGIASLYATKELHEIPYLAGHCAAKDGAGVISVRGGEARQLRQMKVMVLESGKVAFFGDPDEFEKSSLPAVTQLTRHAGSPRVTL
ncbi:MAG TPA: ATP-binding cassette domain-containing protein [Blastocatellia bacterium]|nr:ATP-binding cassette domain-containing protein [Blastocatellia bacterium]